MGKARITGGRNGKAAANPDKPKTKKIVIVDGLECPKELKKVQSDLMTAAEFMEHAEELDWNVHGNEIPVAPRTFTSGNKGWYGGGKMPMTINGKRVWVQLGINITIIGSKAWDEE